MSFKNTFRGWEKMEVQASLRATTKQSSTLENYAKRFSVAASINSLATELKLLADNFSVLDCFVVARNDGFSLLFRRSLNTINNI